MTQPVRVLSIDGGGVRGYLPALLLGEFERRAGKPASELFDLIVGTSTGGIIGIGLATGLPAASLSDFYPKYGRQIFGGSDGHAWKTRIFGRGRTFSERMGSSARTIGAPVGGNPMFGGNARHLPSGLEAVLHDVLGDARLSTCRIDLAITTFDRSTSQPIVLSRRDAVADPNFDLSLRDVARATSAAPTYFPPHRIDWAGATREFIDGGVWANNPSGVALSESLHLTAARQLTGESVLLVSLGTGRAKSTASFAGTESWIGAGGDLVKSAMSVAVGELLARRALSDVRYIRFQIVDDRIAGAMDDPSPARLDLLRASADELVRSDSARIDAVLERLG
jgi:patatin-like phospholipase/acyl hydrolase